MSFRWFQHDNGARRTSGSLVFLIALQVACQAGPYDPSVLEGAYLRVQTALADDRLEGVAADSRVIAAEAQNSARTAPQLTGLHRLSRPPAISRRPGWRSET